LDIFKGHDGGVWFSMLRDDATNTRMGIGNDARQLNTRLF
jgi:hypothetical protein